MYEKTNSFLLCMDLQSYRHDCSSKISRTLFDFLNNTYWVSLFQRNNSLIFWTEVSCFSVTLFYSTLFCCGGKANLVRFTLFYSTLLTLTDGQTDRRRNKYTRFAWAGGTCPHFAWAGGTREALTHGQNDRQRNEYTHFAWAGGTCPRFAWAGGTFFPVVLLCQFLVLAGNRFQSYILLCTWSTIQLWCCVSFFGSGGKLILVSLTYFFVVAGKLLQYEFS